MKTGRSTEETGGGKPQVGEQDQRSFKGGPLGREIDEEERRRPTNVMSLVKVGVFLVVGWLVFFLPLRHLGNTNYSLQGIAMALVALLLLVLWQRQRRRADDLTFENDGLLENLRRKDADLARNSKEISELEDKIWRLQQGHQTHDQGDQPFTYGSEEIR